MLLRCNINAGVHARAGRSRRITQRCHNSLRWETGLASVNDVTHRKPAENFGNLKKVSRVQLVELRLDTGRDGWLSLARGGLGQVSHEMWGRWKGRNRKIVPLPPYVEKPLNSKVIKSFAPELRSRYVFFEFRDSYVLSLWTFDVRFTHSHIMALVHSDCESGTDICQIWK